MARKQHNLELSVAMEKARLKAEYKKIMDEKPNNNNISTREKNEVEGSTSAQDIKKSKAMEKARLKAGYKRIML